MIINTDKAYLNDIRVTNICKNFTHKLGAKTSWHRYGTKLRHCHRMYCDDRDCLFVCPRSYLRKIHVRSSPVLPAPNRGAEYCDERVCLSVSVCLFVYPRSYLRNYTSDIRQFLCMLLTAVARSSSGGVAIRIRYVLPVLSMTSCLHMTTVVYSDTKTTCAQSSSPGGSTGGGVCCPRLPWQYR